MGTWIATRKLTTQDGKPFEVSLGLPREQGDQWRCQIRYTLDGQDDETERMAVGADAFEALQAGLLLIERRARSLKCSMFANDPGWHGFYLTVPLVGGVNDPDEFERITREKAEADMEVAVQKKAAERRAAKAAKDPNP